MIDSEGIKKIKNEIEGFFKKMTFEVVVEILPQENDTLSVNIQADEPQILIGERGQTLDDIHQLLRAMIKKKINNWFFVDVDISDYKKRKAERLKELVVSIADEVSSSKREKFLPPMSASERRIAHLELAERKDVVAESFGKEPERRIKIKPA